MSQLLNLIRRTTGTTHILNKLHQIEAEVTKPAAMAAQASQPVLSGPMRAVRKTIADSFICGHGIEIGAFASPLPVPASAHVRYVDKYNVADIDATHQIAGLSLNDFGVDIASIIQPDIVDNGECLGKVGDYSQDFVIANHVLEHFEDPIKGFKNMHRVLKHDGMLYLALPEMRHSFDKTRHPTPFEHLLRDYEEGPAWSRAAAYAEFATIFAANGMDKGLFPRCSGEALQAFERKIAQELDEADFSIHFHAWTMDSMMEMFARIKQIFHLSFETRLILQNGEEVIFLFQKTVPHVQ